VRRIGSCVAGVYRAEALHASSGQSSWLQIQGSGFDFRRHQIFREVVGLERGPLSLVSTIEELRGGNSSGSCLESREYSRRDPSWCPLSAKVASTEVSPSCGVRRRVASERRRCEASGYAPNGRVMVQ
jgi:hypothetical protein